MYLLVADYFSTAFFLTTAATMVFLFLRGRPGLERSLKLICCLGGTISVGLDITYFNRLLDINSGVSNISWLLIVIVKTISLYAFGLLVYALVRKESTKKFFTAVTITALIAYIPLWLRLDNEIFLVNVDLPDTLPEIALYAVYHIYAITLVSCVSGPLTWEKYREGNETVNAKARYGGVAAGAVLMGIYFFARFLTAVFMLFGQASWAESALAFSTYVVIGGGMLWGFLVLSKKHLVRILQPFIWLRRFIWVHLLADLRFNLDTYCRSTTGSVVGNVSSAALLKSDTIGLFEYSLLIDILDKKRTLNGYLKAPPSIKTELLEMGVIKPQIHEDSKKVMKYLDWLNRIDDFDYVNFDTLLKSYSKTATRLIFVR